MEEQTTANNTSQGGGLSGQGSFVKKIVIGIVVIAVLAAGAYWFFQGQGQGDIIVGNGNGSEQDNEEELIIQDANVTDVEVLMLESFPLQIRVVARGDFPDSCTEIHESEVTQQESTFFIMLTTKRQADAICVQVITPFEEVITIDATGLLKGMYTVNVNGVEKAFELQFDNVFPKG